MNTFSNQHSPFNIVLYMDTLFTEFVGRVP